MNTPTTDTKAKPTLIICEKHDVLGSPSILIEGEKPTVICEFTDWRGTSFTELDRKERDKYKTIFHEAGTVYHEIKLTPRELVERMSKWVYDRTPITFETGDWDGERSCEVVALDKSGKKHIARVYEGVMDGSKFITWVDNYDYEIAHEIVCWMKIPD